MTTLLRTGMNESIGNPDVGGTPVSAYDMFRNGLTTLNYGGKTGGTASQATAVLSMAVAQGFVVFPRGDTVLGTCTIDVPLYFAPGARISVLDSQTVTIRSRINAARRQHIFSGDGFVSLNYANPNGEDSKDVCAAWFGIFPTGGTVINQYAAIVKALNSFGNTREGVFQFDNGSYCIDNSPGPVLVPRGVWLKGVGERRTTFDLINGSGIVFATNGPASKFSDFQFEQPTQSGRTGTLIELRHADCVVDHVRCWNTQYGVVALTGADRPRITNIQSIYGFAPPADSALVWVQSNDSFVDEIAVNGTSFGPRDIVRIGQGNTASSSRHVVADVRTSEASIAVNVIADGFTVSNVNISNVVSGGGSGDTVEAVVKVSTSGSASVNTIAINGVSANEIPTSLIKLVQSSSGSMTEIIGSGSVIRGSAGNGIEITRTNGTIKDIDMTGVNVSARKATGIVLTGAMTEVRLPPYKGGPLADNGVLTIRPPVTGGFVKIKVMGDDWSFPQHLLSGEAFMDFISTVNAIKISGGGAFAAVATSLTGTTGNNGDVTLGISGSNQLQIENRSGSPQTFEISWL